MAIFESFVLAFRLWPDEMTGPFQLVIHFAWLAGRMEPVGLDIRTYGHDQYPVREIVETAYEIADNPPRPLTTTDLRALPLASLVDEVRSKELQRNEVRREALRKRWPMSDEQAKRELRRRGYIVYPVPPDMRERERRALSRDEELWSRSPRRGRPPTYPPEHWEQVAQAYQEAYSAGRTPTLALARRFRVSKTTAAKWVARCRDMGLLPPTTRGKARAAAEKQEGER